MFIDLNIYLVPFTVTDTIELLSYFAFKCNGTVLLGEIHRRIMSDLEFYFELYLNCRSMYVFLCEVNKIIAPDKAIGSCTECRYMYSGGSSTVDWSTKSSDLFEVIMNVRNNTNDVVSKARLMKEVSVATDHLIKGRNKSSNALMFPGAGAMGTNHFIHGAALLGLLPLGCYNIADITDASLGPGRIIKRCFNMDKEPTAEECSNVLHELHSQYGKIWNDMPSMNFMENSLCYLCRTVENTLKKVNKVTEYIHHDVEIVKDDSQRVESSKKNVYFMDEHRGRIQNMFAIRTCGNGSSSIRPVLMMKDASNWELGDSANIAITNWERNKNDKAMLSWNTIDGKLALNSVMNISDKLVHIYSK